MNKHDQTNSVAQISRRSLLTGGAGIATLIATGTGATLLLSGCAPQAPTTSSPGKTPGALKPETASYMTSFGFIASFGEVMMAAQEGFFKDFDLDLTIKGGQGTATAIQAVLGNSVEIARTNGINAIVAVANEGTPLLTIAEVFQQSQFDLCSLADKPINSPADLKGKTVGIVSAGGATENLLNLMLVSANVDRASVKRPITGVGTAAYQLAKDGKIDAWISVDADRKTINDKLGKINFFPTSDYAKVPGDTYNISQQLIDSGSDVPTRFLAGVLKAMKWGSDQANWPKAVKDILFYNPSANAEDTLAGMPVIVDDWTAGGKNQFLQLNESLWTGGQDLLAQAGLIKKAASLDKLIYSKYLDDARKMV